MIGKIVLIPTEQKERLSYACVHYPPFCGTEKLRYTERTVAILAYDTNLYFISHLLDVFGSNENSPDYTTYQPTRILKNLL
jgi:hypothetical protein